MNREIFLDVTARASLKGLNMGNLAEIYDLNFRRWLFRESDNIKDVNGNIILDFSSYLFENGDIIPSGEVSGYKLTEVDFIEAIQESNFFRSSKNLGQKRNIETFIEYAKTKVTTEPIIVFDEILLTKICKEFEDEIWEPISLADFLASFEGKGNKIKIKKGKKGYFYYLLGCIEEMRDKKKIKNMEIWVKAIFGIDDYNGKKRNDKDEDSETYISQHKIKAKIDNILKQYEV